VCVDDGGSDSSFKPCFSAVWDTANRRAYAVAAAEPKNSSPRTLLWIGSSPVEIRRQGDWSVKASQHYAIGMGLRIREMGFYPDIDDTAMVLLALATARGTKHPVRRKPASTVRLNWILAMQSRDGGWAAFDADNNWNFLSDVPFADHNAMLDPACPDITGRVLEALGAHGFTNEHPAVRRGVEFLVAKPGTRWKLVRTLGCRLYLAEPASPFAVWRAGRESGYASAHPARPANGSVRFRMPTADGVKRCASYDNGIFHRPGPSTPSQTALGQSSASFAAAMPGSLSVQTASSTFSKHSVPRKLGTTQLATEPAFPGSSI